MPIKIKLPRKQDNGLSFCAQSLSANIKDVKNPSLLCAYLAKRSHHNTKTATISSLLVERVAAIHFAVKAGESFDTAKQFATEVQRALEGKASCADTFSHAEKVSLEEPSLMKPSLPYSPSSKSKEEEDHPTPPSPEPGADRSLDAEGETDTRVKDLDTPMERW